MFYPHTIKGKPTFKFVPPPLEFNGFGFDGSTKYITTAPAANLSIGTGNKSFSLWINTTSTSTGQMLWSGNHDAGALGYYISLNPSGQIDIEVSSSLSNRYRAWSTETFNDGEQHNIVVVFTTPSNFTVYVDDVLVTTPNLWGGNVGSPVDVDSSSFTFEIGRRTDVATQRFNGSITSVCVHDGLLSPAERTEIYNNGVVNTFANLSTSITDDAVLFYTMSSCDNSLVDESSSGNNGTSINGVTSDGVSFNFEPC